MLFATGMMIGSGFAISARNWAALVVGRERACMGSAALLAGRTLEVKTLPVIKLAPFMKPRRLCFCFAI